MRVGLFGGSFDPVHYGHLGLSQKALHHFNLDLIIWIPSAQAPHKDKVYASFTDRVNMLRLALQGKDQHEISTIESELPQPSYSIVTIQALKLQHSHIKEWFFIIGSDSWTHFKEWYHWEEILQELDLIVYPRQGHPLPQSTFNVHILQSEEFAVSSTDVREGLAKKRYPLHHQLLPENCEPIPVGVLDYIAENHLYGF